jgi:hypothetical protein
MKKTNERGEGEKERRENERHPPSSISISISISISPLEEVGEKSKCESSKQEK